MWQDSDSGQMGFWASWQKSNHLPGDRKAWQRKTELGHSRMGQSPCPGLTDLYPLSVSMEIIGPGWLEWKWKCWIAWGLAEPWVVKRSNQVLCKQGPKLRHLSLQTESNNHSTSDQKYYNATQDDSTKQQNNLTLNTLVPSLLYLSKHDQVLNRQTQRDGQHSKVEKWGYPAHHIDTSLNGVSVLGCVGEWSPWVCPQQCKGWSLGVRYKALGALGSLQSCKVWHGALPW